MSPSRNRLKRNKHVRNGMNVSTGNKLKPGETIWQYEVEAFLGSGAFGNVYLAHHRTMRRRRVAIKQLRMSEAPPSIVKRFIHESYAMGELYHPNVVLIYELIEPEMYPDIDTYYIVMEYVDGGTLLDWMNKPERPLASLSEQIRILKAVCRGLAMAHQEGIFHRDIKPENILLNRDGSQIKIGDWGLAHLESHKMTVLGDVLGTMDYMPPEQSSGQSINADARSDLYSLGVIFYEMVTGHVCLDLESIGNQAVMEFLQRNPLQAGNKQLLTHVAQKACLEAIQRLPRTDSRVYAPKVPQSVHDFLMRAVTIDPADRFQSANEFIAGLDELAAETTAPPPRKRDERVAKVATMLVQARQLRQNLQYNEAIVLLEEARSLLGGEVGVCLELARIYNILHRPAEALKVLMQALEGNGDNYVILRDLGITYKAMGEKEKALDALRRSLELNPTQTQIKTLCTQLERQLGL